MCTLLFPFLCCIFFIIHSPLSLYSSLLTLEVSPQENQTQRPLLERPFICFEIFTAYFALSPLHAFSHTASLLGIWILEDLFPPCLQSFPVMENHESTQASGPGLPSIYGDCPGTVPCLYSVSSDSEGPLSPQSRGHRWGNGRSFASNESAGAWRARRMS